MSGLKFPDTETDADPPEMVLGRIEIKLPIVTLSHLVGRTAPDTYQLPRDGETSFEVKRFGLTMAQGRSSGVVGRLSVDMDEGSIDGLTLEFEPDVVDVEWTDLIPGFSPSGTLPLLRFDTSARLACPKAGRHLRGLLDVGGTRQLQTFEVSLRDRVHDPITDTEIASYVLEGRVDLGLFGLPEEQSFLGELVVVSIELDVELGTDEA